MYFWGLGPRFQIVFLDGLLGHLKSILTLIRESVSDWKRFFWQGTACSGPQGEWNHESQPGPLFGLIITSSSFGGGRGMRKTVSMNRFSDPPPRLAEKRFSKKVLPCRGKVGIGLNSNVDCIIVKPKYDDLAVLKLFVLSL